jgi:hypothetical protein
VVVRPHFNVVVLLGGLLIGLCAASLAVAQESQAMLETLTYDLSEKSAEIFVKTSTPVPGFRCRLALSGSPEITLEIPNVASQLEERYTLASPLVPEIRVERGHLDGGDGVRVLFALGSGSLESVKQVGGGIVLRFEAATDRRAVPDDSDGQRPDRIADKRHKVHGKPRRHARRRH